jgi:hypothetical protein
MQSTFSASGSMLSMLEIGNLENDAVCVDPASMFYQIILPQKSAFFDLLPVIPAFMQQTDSAA